MSKQSKYSDLKRTSNEQPLKEVLDRWMKAYGFEERAKQLEIVNAWPDLKALSSPKILTPPMYKSPIASKILCFTNSSS